MEAFLGPLLVAVLPLLFAGILRGITGFGLLLVATPLLFQLFPPKTVIAALIIPAMVANLAVLWRDGVPWAHLNSHRWVYVSGAVGAVIGVVGLVVLDQTAIFLIVAGYIVVFLVLQHWRKIAQQVAAASGMSVIAGGSGGLLGGAIGLSGPPIVTYFHAKDLSKTYFVGLLAVFFLTVGAVRIPSMYTADLFGMQEVVLGVAFTIPAVFGTYLGAIARPRVPQRVFTLGVEVFLLLIAVNLVLDAFSVSIL